MPHTTRCRQTSTTVRRHVKRQTKEQYGVQGSGFIGENHTELTSYDSGSGVAWFYPGAVPFPCGSSQVGTQPV